ncbi:MAG: hypothetical protein RL006_942, partial [Chloroflexota bacterium]
MTQDDEHMIGRLRHEARVRWTTSADGKKGWKPDDVRSAVILDAAAFIEKQSERIFDLEKAAEMLRVAEID